MRNHVATMPVHIKVRAETLQGYMAGEMGMDKTRCPYRGEVIIAAWEAGWDDAGQVRKQRPQKDDDLFSRIA